MAIRIIGVLFLCCLSSGIFAEVRIVADREAVTFKEPGQVEEVRLRLFDGQDAVKWDSAFGSTISTSIVARDDMGRYLGYRDQNVPVKAIPIGAAEDKLEYILLLVATLDAPSDRFGINLSAGNDVNPVYLKVMYAPEMLVARGMSRDGLGTKPSAFGMDAELVEDLIRSNDRFDTIVGFIVAFGGLLSGVIFVWWNEKRAKKFNAKNSQKTNAIINDRFDSTNSVLNEIEKTSSSISKDTSDLRKSSGDIIDDIKKLAYAMIKDNPNSHALADQVLSKAEAQQSVMGEILKANDKANREYKNLVVEIINSRDRQSDEIKSAVDKMFDLIVNQFTIAGGKLDLMGNHIEYLLEDSAQQQTNEDNKTDPYGMSHSIEKIIQDAIRQSHLASGFDSSREDAEPIANPSRNAVQEVEA